MVLSIIVVVGLLICGACTLIRGAWLVFASLALGATVPRFIRVHVWMLIADVISLALFFRWPLILPLVGWIDLALVLTGVFPWEEKGIQNLFYQFPSVLAFFVAAHAVAFSKLAIRKLALQEIAPVV
jgi:hypothetical protein